MNDFNPTFDNKLYNGVEDSFFNIYDEGDVI